MPFDDKTRNRLQRFVSDARKVLTGEFTAQLQNDYGLDPLSGNIIPLDQLKVDDTRRETARVLRQTFDHYLASMPDAKPAVVLDRIVREQAFTILNRLVALRMCEARDLLKESIGSGTNSQGFQLFQRLAGAGLGETAETYRAYVLSVFDEFAVDLGVLFERFSPMGLLFPSETSLLGVLGLIDDPELAELWGEDETIGWLYQYFNSKEERKKMRDESSAPRNSRELAVRNQFFTPRYVVEFLTDNTLGRIWYEMRKGATALKEQCRYLVRRPTEIFLGPGDVSPAASELAEGQGAGRVPDLSQSELLKQPVHIPHRPLKDPREIRLLDPACGSMHFGLYAFDLFTVIYDEAWEIAHDPDDAAKSAETFAPFVTFAATFLDKSAFLREVPRFIIEHNIHGIDIDPRAAQIAGLSLWLRAQRAWHQAGVKPADRPRITRSNLVCAEPMPGEKELLREFVEQQFPAGERPAFAFLLEAVFDRMTLAGEAGSLLRIEDEIRAAIAEAKRLWKAGPQHEQAKLFPETGARPGQGEMRLDLSGITDEQFWERAEQRIYDALEAYAEQAENGGGFQRRLFADDAAQGFAFIDLCRKRYDVVVMNPPFGEFPPGVVDYVCEKIPEGRNDIYSAMIFRLADCLMHADGRLGAITSRAFVVGRDLRDYRKALIRDDGPRLSIYLDLGAGVLDGAMVETAAYIVANERQDELLHRDLRPLKETERQEHIIENNWNVIPLSVFRTTHDNQFLFGLDISALEALQDLERFIPNFAEVTQGLVTEDNTRFLCLRWEVPVEKFGDTWFIFAKGGDYSWFTSDLHLAVKRRNDGAELAAFAETKSGNVARTRQSSKFYGIPGATYSGRSQKGFSCRRLRSETCFSNKSGVIFPIDRDEENWRRVLPLLLASESYLQLIDAQSKFGSYEVGSIKLLPRPDSKLLNLQEVATGIYRQLDALEQQIETSSLFVTPRIAPDAFVKTWQNVMSQVSAALHSNGLALRHEIPVFQNKNAVALDEECCGLAASVSYAFGTAFGRWDIRYATGERPAPEVPDPFAPLPVCPPGMLQGDDGMPLSKEEGRRMKEAGKYPLDVAWDGILVDDPEHPLDLERRVHAALAVLWGGSATSANRADALEHEACALLGVPTLREWFRHPAGFFADHLKRYSKSRRQAPIYWPLSTASGSYTLWIYYHRLTDQTLFACVNEFVEPKLRDVRSELAGLSGKTGRSSVDESRLEELQRLSVELAAFLDELLRLTKIPWKPNLNDGVQITAAPLWKLFRLPKWQKTLKETWQKLERGDYDWAHLAYSIWPERVREKCKGDKSLAIAHGLEELYVEPLTKKTKKRKAPADVGSEELDFV